MIYCLACPALFSPCTVKCYTMHYMYNVCTQDVLDSLCGKMEAVRQRWDSESRDIEHRTQQILLEFGAPG